MTSEQRPDPFLEARVWSCRRCGAEAYPTDAAWLTEDLVLATFGQSHRGECRAPRAWAVIIDVDGDSQSFAYAPPGNATLARAYYRRHSCPACGALTGARYCDTCRCQALTIRGQRCANRAASVGTCAIHTRRGDEDRAGPQLHPDARSRREVR